MCPGVARIHVGKGHTKRLENELQWRRWTSPMTEHCMYLTIIYNNVIQTHLKKKKKNEFFIFIYAD